MDHFLVTRRVSEGLQSAPRSRFGLPLRGTSALARDSMGETRHLYPLLSCTSTVLRTEHEREKQRILVFDALKFG